MAEPHQWPDASAYLVGGPDDLSDETYQELGRLTMAAIRLEDLVIALCQRLSPSRKPQDKRSAGTLIEDALKVLRNSGDGHAVIRDWLCRADQALDRRNQTLHASPTFVVPLPGTTPTIRGATLVYVPRDGGDHTLTPLTVEELQPITADLRAARAGWEGAVEVVWAEAESTHSNGYPASGQSRSDG